MFPATTKGGGLCVAFPDVCKTPAVPSPIPVPYPNMANPMDAKAETCSKKVKILNKPVCTVMSQMAMSTGDEAGSAGGVVSGCMAGVAAFKVGSFKVFIEGNPIVTFTALTAHNGTSANAPLGTQIAPSQAKVIIVP